MFGRPHFKSLWIVFIDMCMKSWVVKKKILRWDLRVSHIKSVLITNRHKRCYTFTMCVPMNNVVTNIIMLWPLLVFWWCIFSHTRKHVFFVSVLFDFFGQWISVTYPLFTFFSPLSLTGPPYYSLIANSSIWKTISKLRFMVSLQSAWVYFFY